MERISFYDQIARNKRNSVLLTLFVGIMIIALGYAISFAFPTEYVFFILSISIIIGVFWPIISYYNSGNIAVWSVGAIPANRTQFKQYYDIVEGLTLASGLPMPKLYIMRGQQINAFASGKDPQNAVVCLTEGALMKLNKQELEGVLAHEMSHVANYDIRFMTLVSVLVGIISIMAQMFLRSLWYSDRNNNEGKNGGIFILIGIVLAILAPIVTTLVQLAVSRKREYGADATAVKFTRTPTGLIGALSKIKNDKSEIKVSGSMAPLFFTKPSLSLVELFSTHPPLEKRIEILKKM
jgi:heat shock protein HtpX